VSLDSFTVVWFAALVIAVILHEISHGVVALAFGDDTARRAGRLTLNPVPHIDPFGSIILPLMGALAHVPVIAWAKPVPVNPARLRNQRRDMLMVSLAGPCTNFGLAFVSAIFARWAFQRLGTPFSGSDDLPLSVLFPLLFAATNLFLGMFNLLPIPPLDGASIIERFLPREWLPGWYRFRQYGILLLIVLVFVTRIPERVITPFLVELYRFVLT
jgi:Zn-dependent protease